jgi:CxxC-x17-CxxC domain-containing protein
VAYQDRTLTCVECGQEFTFSSDDQDFHAKKGYQEPKRCPNCRANRRASLGGGSRSGGYGSRTMYDATCANCGNETQVPFLPRQDRPVYCSDCFSKMRPAGSRGGGRW